MREWQEHQLTHLPFRSWCPHCVAAKSEDDLHRKREPIDKSGVPELHMDCCFLRSRPSDENATAVVAKERKCRYFFAHVVPAKGTSGASWVAKQLAADVRNI